MAGCTSSPPDRAGTPPPEPDRTSRAEPAPSVPHGTSGDRRPRGTDAWRITRPAQAGEIEGYADRVGAVPGTVVGLRVSTTHRWFRVTAYRLGTYRGGDGHQVWRSGRIRGTRQPDAVLQPAGTRTVVAPWRDSLRLDTTGWEPGLYVLKMVTNRGLQAGAPYVVTSPSTRGRVALVVPVTTWQAYNVWGGYSLYAGADGDRRAWRVSFDRPYPPPGLGELPFASFPVVREAEATRTPLAYLTNIDLHTRPRVLAGARGYVSTGHDEYWTPRMRRTVERARDAGTNLAFLAANTMYWRVRLERSASGPARRMVGYRSDAALDPAHEHSPADVTGRFRDAPAPDAEHRLVGMLYECFPVDADYRVVTPGWWGFAGTGVRRGTTFPGLVGDEADRVYPVPGTPRPLQVLSNDDYSCRGVPTSAQSTYYTHRSGAGVVSVGTLRWTCTLTRACFGTPMAPRTVAFVRTVTRTIVREFARGPVSERHPARDNVDRFHLPTVNTVPAS